MLLLACACVLSSHCERISPNFVHKHKHCSELKRFKRKEQKMSPLFAWPMKRLNIAINVKLRTACERKARLNYEL